MVTYQTSVVYVCEPGYALANRETNLAGLCEADGVVAIPFGTGDCEPITCGTPPAVPGASLLLASGEAMPDGYVSAYGTDAVTVQCNAGETLGGVAGAAAAYTLECSMTGALVGSASGVCQTPRYDVGGILSDAQSAARRLVGATVRVTSEDGATVVSTATAVAGGVYWVSLPAGTWKFEASKDGYITTTRTITIAGYVGTGGLCDMSMSQVLGEGEWRAVVEWAAHTRDIDSHIWWNDRAAHVYWSRRAKNDYASGISVVLDRDDVNGYGPETTSFSGIGHCTVTSRCLVQFEIDNYTPRDGDLGASEVHVKLYKGSALAMESTIPTSVGAARSSLIFTLDARAGENNAYQGARILPPFLKVGRPPVTNWAQSFDNQMWSFGEPESFLSGFRNINLDHLHRLHKAQSIRVKGTAQMLDCQEVDVNLNAQGWASCPAGRWMNGMFRAGGRYTAGTGVQQITKLSCCRPVEALEEWGECREIPVFRARGQWDTCPEVTVGTISATDETAVMRPSAMVALHRGELTERLDALDKMKCCAFKKMGLLAAPN